MTVSRKNWYGGRMITGTSCAYKTLSFPVRKVICMMTYRWYACQYGWTSKTCWFFSLSLVSFIFLPYIFMVIFPKLLLLWSAFFMLSMWLPALFAPKIFIRILEKTLKNTDIVRLWAFITMIIWLLFLSVYRKFNHGWAMFFSFFWWLSLLKGLVLLRFPGYGYTKYKWFYAKPVGSIVMWLLICLFALFTIRVAYYRI